MKPSFAVVLFLALMLTACEKNPREPDTAVFSNQLGYRTEGSKGVLVQARTAQHWQLRDAKGNTVASGETVPARWQETGSYAYWADFSPVQTAGDFQFSLNGTDRVAVHISHRPWLYVHDAAIKSFYLNRASQALDSNYAGEYARAAGHADSQVRVHASAATTSRPAGTVISAPGGWYDAGDYNKYVVNAGISTYTLLLAHQMFPDFYQNRQWHIPESGGRLPDLLAEIKYNLDWLLAMQDEDGGVYHKLTSLTFNPMEMPDVDDDTRYVVHKNTAATLNFIAVMANASRAYQHFSPSLSEQYLDAAFKAWQWALANPALTYQQPDDVVTGEYGDKNLEDEWFWAGAELAVTTGSETYLKPLPEGAAIVPAWSDVATLGLITLASFGENHQWRAPLFALADELLARTQAQPGFAMSANAGDYVWGSNAVAMNQAMVFIVANKLSGDPRHRDAAEKLLHYVMGANPTGYSFITGLGTKQAKHIHHRASEADGIDIPIPGMLIGGPNPDQQDQCDGYPSKLPALSYLDDVCSYSTNETAINWTAPLVFVLAAFAQTHD